MSRFYEMTVDITEYDPSKVAEIQSAAADEWPFADWWFSCEGENEMHSSAQDTLGGGETEEQFTERLAIAIWRANGRYCNVGVDATYLEELPYQTHTLDEADYARLIEGASGG